MKTVLPGAAIGLFGGGENSRMFTVAARRMGYRVHIYSNGGDAAGSMADMSTQAPYEDLDRVREFASGVDAITVADAKVPLIALQAAAGSTVVRPSPGAFEAIENGIGAKLDAAGALIADFSVIAARAADGECAFYPPMAIDRVDGMVDIARSPAPLDARIVRKATSVTRDLLEELKLTGIAGVEFVLTQEQELLVREVTPHPHRSGHLTVDACVTGQFEQQLRAVCGLPLGSVTLLRPAAMAVLSEEAWRSGEPDWVAACALPQVKLHLYGWREGHLTATSASATRAKQIVLAARASLAA